MRPITITGCLQYACGHVATVCLQLCLQLCQAARLYPGALAVRLRILRARFVIGSASPWAFHQTRSLCLFALQEAGCSNLVTTICISEQSDLRQLAWKVQFIMDDVETLEFGKQLDRQSPA